MIENIERSRKMNTQASNEPHFEMGAESRAIPGGWDLSAIPDRNTNTNSEPLPSEIADIPVQNAETDSEEIRFSDWQLEPYFDDIPASFHRNWSA
jgi:hypothetical protein